MTCDKEIEVEHDPTCTANYPEKIAGESPQQLEVIHISGGEIVYSCVDCGAYVITGEENGNV